MAKTALAKSLGSFIKSNNKELTKESFNDFAKHLYVGNQNDLMSIQVTKDSIISFNYPSKGNEVTLGLNIISHEQNSQNIRRLYQEKKSMTVGPRILLQNKLGMVYRNPIILDDENKTLFGYAVLVFDINRMLGRIQQISSLKDNIGLYSFNEGLSQDGFFFGDSTIINNNHVFKKVKLPHDTWVVYSRTKEPLMLSGLNHNDIKVIIALISLTIALLTTYSIQSILSTYQTNKVLNEKNRFIENQLNEKSVLIQEIHHRIKNHFQMISSLNKLKYQSEDNHELMNIIADINNRVHSIASAYDQLSPSRADDEQLKWYIKSLCNNLKSTLNNKLEFEISTNNCEINAKRKITMGVIITEAITNAIKHAYENTEEPKFLIELSLIDDYYHLKMMDNGNLLPDNILDQTTDSQGIEIIVLICEQLKAKIEIVRENSWNGFLIKFKK